MNWYHCAQPTYEDIDILEAWNPTPDEEQALRPAPGTPAPRAPQLMVPLFPRRPKTPSRKASSSSSTAPPKLLTKRYLSTDCWRYGVMLFCDVSTLLRLHVVCTQLRQVLNDPAFVVEWQTACWYLQTRGCVCERNLFYLDVCQYLDFAFDCLGITSTRVSDVALKSTGRTANLDYATRIPLPHVDPRRAPRCFASGLLDVWMENWIVPMPRMLFVPVEDTQVHSGGHGDPFWLDHHPVPEQDGEESETPAQTARRGLAQPPPTHFVRTGPDLVQAYESDCRSVGRDPHDPVQDNDDCLGYHATRWARRRLYETAVGIQTYPLHLCLRRSDLVGRAYRSGMEHLESLFLPVQRSLTAHTDGDIQMLTHTGPIYFHPVRYNNESGDFQNWALATLAVTQGVYQHAWFDSVQHTLQRLDDFARTLAMEVEQDLPMYRMCDRWCHLHRRVFLGEAAWPPDPRFPDGSTQPTDRAARQQQRDQAALDVMYDPHYASYNRLLNRMAERNDNLLGADEDGILMLPPYSSHYRYLSDLLGDRERYFAHQRTEATLMHELRELMRLTDYIVRFSMTIGPMTDPLTEMRRFRCLEAYLGAGTSLLMFAPSFRRVPSWRPSEHTLLTAAGRVPRMNLQSNHRFRRYLRFLNRRTLFYVPDPHLPADAYPTEIAPRS